VEGPATADMVFFFLIIGMRVDIGGSPIQSLGRQIEVLAIVKTFKGNCLALDLTCNDESKKARLQSRVGQAHMLAKCLSTVYHQLFGLLEILEDR
jgi:hypothetical protein